MGTIRGGRRAVGAMAAVLAVLVVASACSNSSGGSASKGSASTSNQPGVTKDAIRVGGVASVTNPLAGDYASVFDGAAAYLAMVNSQGGMYGRKLELVARRDDQVVNNLQQVQGLLSQDNVFAALPMATIYSFSGAPALTAAGVPTFGWGINDQWNGPPNLFSSLGYFCVTNCLHEDFAWILQQLHKTKVATLGYNVANSTDCVNGFDKTLQAYPVAKVVYENTSLTFGQADFSVEVRKMKDAGVDFIVNCTDQNASLNLAKEMRKQSLDATLWLPNSYDHAFIQANGQFFEGAIVQVQYAPFETQPQPSGLQEFQTWMKKIDKPVTEVSVIGWINADLFVTGLKAAGPDFTRQKVVDALNKLTDYTASGVVAPQDWTINHTQPSSIDCSAYVEVQHSAFVPAFGKPGKPFICFPHAPATLPAEPSSYAS